MIPPFIMRNSHSGLLSCAAFVFLSLFSVNLYAETLDFEGYAVISGADKAKAKQAAIQNALLQASSQGESSVVSSESVSSSGQRLQSSRVREAAIAPEYKLVREWVEGDFFHVVIRFESPAEKQTKKQSHAYKKKVVLTPFVVNQPYRVGTDFSEFHSEMIQRLESTKSFLVRSSKYSISSNSSGDSEAEMRTSIKQMATNNDAQFVLSGEIFDTAHVPTTSLFERLKGKTRSFEIRVTVYDGLTGVRLSHHRFNKMTKGDVNVESNKPFGSAEFFSTNFGATVSSLIDESVKSVLDDIERIPFTARVSRVSGKKIYLDAGATSLIAPGDSLVVFHVQNDLSVHDVITHSEYGVPETPVTSVLITNVYPLFSIGELQTGQNKHNIGVGDLVRFDHKSRQQ